jgi:hypothetical protein
MAVALKTALEGQRQGQAPPLSSKDVSWSLSYARTVGHVLEHRICSPAIFPHETARFEDLKMWRLLLAAHKLSCQCKHPGFVCHL